MSTTYSPESWLTAATLEYDAYWLAVEPGTEHLIEIPEGEPHRVYGIRCDSDEDGDIILTVIGDGAGYAYANRYGDGAGHAHAFRSGSGEGSAIAYRYGSGAGNAHANRSGDGSGYASASRYGSGAGNSTAHRSGSGAGSADAHRFGDGSGNSTAHRDGDGEGSATANRFGDGDGNAHANRYGAGEGSATETDSRGTRRSVDHSGIGYRCFSGDGYLRVGCEVHLLADWVANADAIDARHGDGIAEHTRALATRLQKECRKAQEED